MARRTALIKRRQFDGGVCCTGLSLFSTRVLSPDGKRVVVDGVDGQGNRDIWLIELASGNLTRFTFDPGTDIFPIWSPDGTPIVFSSDREGPRNLYQKTRSVPVKKTCCLKQTKTASPSTGLLMGDTSSTWSWIRKLSSILGSCLCLETRSHFLSCKLKSVNGTQSSRLMAGGSHTHQTNRA